MAKFRESDLNDVLKNFTNCTLELEFDKIINGKIVLKDAKIEFNDKTGFIHITSNNNSFKINTTLVYLYEKENDEIYIDLDTLLLKIKKIT